MDLHKNRRPSTAALICLARAYYGISMSRLTMSRNMAKLWGWLDEENKLTDLGLAVLVYHARPTPHKAPPEVVDQATDGPSELPLDQLICALNRPTAS